MSLFLLSRSTSLASAYPPCFTNPPTFYTPQSHTNNSLKDLLTVDQNLIDFFDTADKKTKKTFFHTLYLQDSILSFLQELITRKSLSSENKKKFIHEALSFLSATQNHEIAEELFHHHTSTYYALILLINKPQHLEIFLRPIIQKKDDETYFTFLECICRQIPVNNAERPVVLHYLLNNKSKKKSVLEPLMERSSTLSVHTKQCLIWCASTELRERVLKTYSRHTKDFADTLKAILAFECEWERKIKLCEDFLNCLTSKQLEEHIDYLISNYLEILIYLPCALNTEAFDKFFLSRENEIFKNSRWPIHILNAIKIEKTSDVKNIATKLFKQNRLEYLLKIMEHFCNSTRDGPTLFTVEELKNTIQTCSSENIFTYGEELAVIPPFLIALSMHSPNFRPFIIQCLPFWEEQQLAAIGTMITEEEFNHCAETCPSALLDLMTTAPIKCFLTLIKKKIEEMEITLPTFQSRSKLVEVTIHHLKTCIKEQKALKNEEYDDLVGQIIKLKGVLNKYLNPLFLILHKHIQKNTFDSVQEEQAAKKYSELYQQITTLHKKLQSTSYHTDLEELKKHLKIDPQSENEEKDTYPQEFLHLMTEKMKGLLRLPSGEEAFKRLAQIGVKDAKDLKDLGYQKEKENILGLIRIKILGSCTDNYLHTVKAENLWDNLFYSEGNFRKKALLFVEKFDLEKIDKDLLKDIKLLTSTVLEGKPLDRSKIELLDPQKELLNALDTYKKHAITIKIKNKIL